MLSVVIPVLDEAGSLMQLHQELTAVARERGYELDVIFIDDGSRDASWSLIEQLSERDPQVRGLRFRRNFGKSAALSAGFAACRGDFVFTLDADLQDDPRELPRFLEKIHQGFDVVSGWKQQRFDPWHKVLPSRIFNRLVSRMTGVHLHDHNCGFKCYRRDVLRELQLYGELHRFVPVLAAARGWRVGEIVVAHRPRIHGSSKFGVGRIPKGFLDLLTVKFLTGYGQRPQHLLGMWGLAAFSLGVLGILWLSAWWVLSRIIPGWEIIHLTQKAIFFYCMGAAIIGAQFMSIGFLAELLNALQGDRRATYSIAARSGGDAAWGSADRRNAGRGGDQVTSLADDEPAVPAPHLTGRRASDSTRERS